MPQFSSPRGFGAAAVACLLAVPGCVDISGSDFSYVEREEKRFTTQGRPELTLATFDGAIEVRSWDSAEILVVVDKRGSDKAAVDTIKVEMGQDGDHIRVDARPGDHDGGFGWTWRRSAALQITVPRHAVVRARTGDGRIAVQDVSGEVSAQSGDGSIRIEDVEGTVDAQSGDGSIRVNGTLSRVRARSGDGSVTIRAARGSTAQDNWSVSTGDGSVTLELPREFAAQLDAHTGDGRVSIRDIDIRDETRSDRQTVRGRLGEGGHTLRVETGDGSITLRPF